MWYYKDEMDKHIVFVSLVDSLGLFDSPSPKQVAHKNSHLPSKISGNQFSYLSSYKLAKSKLIAKNKKCYE